MRQDTTPRIARHIRAARAYAGLSRAQVAAACGVNPQTVGYWERGAWAKEPPKLSHLRAIADVTKVPEEWRAVGFLEPDPLTLLEALEALQAILLARRGAGQTAPTSGPSDGPDDPPVAP